MTRHHVYLDHNATTPLRAEAAAAMTDAMAVLGNPSSVHRAGRAARRVVEDARERVAALAGATPAAVIFTSGGTEANALGLAGCGRRRVLVSAVEHVSVLDAVPGARRLPVDRNGVVALDALAEALADGGPPAVVSVMLANNETGVIQPVAAVAELAARHGAIVHCDAVQAAGKVPLDLAALGVHSLAVSAHKIGGPSGSGALITTAEVVTPLLRGGGQERRRRPGSENVVGIAGFGAAAAAVGDRAHLRGAADSLERLRDRLEARLMTVTPGARIAGAGAARLANTTCFIVPGVAAETLVMALDLAGVAASAGSACSSGKVASSHVLEAMDFARDASYAGVRVSTGWTTTQHDIDTFVDAWSALAHRLGLAATPDMTAAA